MVAILIAFGLSGCSGDSTTTGSNDLVGSWSNGCEEDNQGDSYILTLTFSSAESNISHKSYNGVDCLQSNFIKEDASIRSYTIGSATQYSNGNPATEIDLAFKDENIFYSMYSIEGDILYLSEDDATHDSETPETRANSYDLSLGRKKVI